MGIYGIETAKSINNIRVIYLILLIPIFLFLIIYSSFLVLGKFGYSFSFDLSYFSYSILYFLVTLPFLLAWLFFSLKYYREIIFYLTFTKLISRKDNPKIYNIVENFSIIRGINIPKIGIISADDINAFSLGWNPKNSYIIFTTGLLEKLSEKEIEAVIAHEITHIYNGDSRVMIILNVFTGILGTLGIMLLFGGIKSKFGKNKFGLFITIFGLLFLFLSIIIYPFIKLGVGKRKEYLADIGSIELTKDNNTLISALKKSLDTSRIPIVESRGEYISSMFFTVPRKEMHSSMKKIPFSSIFSSHPSIDKRIKMIKKYFVNCSK